MLLFEKNSFRNRGIIGSLVLSSVLVGVVLGAIVCFIFTFAINLNNWGWRVPFLLSLPLGIWGIKLRYVLNDFESFKRAKNKSLIYKAPTNLLFKNYNKELLFGISVVSVYSMVTSTLIVNLPYLLEKIGWSHEVAMAAVTISLVLIIFLTPFFGFVCRGLKPINIFYIASILIIICFPISFELLSFNNFPSLVASILIISFLIALLSSTIFSAIVGVFPFGVRYSGVSLAFNLSITIFSSSTPFVLVIFEHTFKEYVSGIYISVLTGLMILLSSFLYKKIILHPS